MFSRLDSLFVGSQIRQAEPLDTRQAIRRHEDEQGRRDQNQDHRRDDSDIWEDHTEISVTALRSFLHQLLGDAQGGASPAATQPGTAPDENRPHSPEAGRAAVAAQAYQRTYDATHAATRAVPIPNDAVPSIKLSENEVRAINRLIGDLGKLSERNIDILQLQKSESFLQSIIDAVDALK